MLRFVGELSAVAILGLVAIVGFFVGFPTRVGTPGHDITIHLLLALSSIVIAVTCVAAFKGAKRRHQILRVLSVLAVISVVASLLMHLFQRGLVQTSPAHVLGPLLRVDGQFAFEAAEFEVYCELWLCAAALVGGAIFVVWLSRSLLMRLGS